MIHIECMMHTVWDTGDMASDSIGSLEYEMMVLGRHLTGLPGHSRRSRGELDQSAYTLLSLLTLTGPASIGELSAVTGLDASTLNRQTGALTRDGYAERIPDAAGGMARKFRPTEAGRKALEEERRASRVALESLVEDWDERDTQALSDLLQRLNREIETRVGRTWPRPD